jgi:hypothetical protein
MKRIVGLEKYAWRFPSLLTGSKKGAVAIFGCWKTANIAPLNGEFLCADYA